MKNITSLLEPENVKNAVQRDELQSNRARLLERILFNKQSGCKFFVMTSSGEIFATEGDRSFLPAEDCR
jgi:hypothetical protein